MNNTASIKTLPSEVRKQIVSYLAPLGNDARAIGSKNDLQNANRAHRCLRECVPEYMFETMVLNWLEKGVACHLERFALDPNNANYLKYVKRIIVQVRMNHRAFLIDSW